MTPTEKDAMALAVLDVFASAPFLQICCGQAQGGGMDENGNGEPPSCCGQPIGGAEIADARAHLASRIAELEAELAAVRANAERYLHLREANNADPTPFIAQRYEHGIMQWTGEEADAAVDAARGGE